MSSSVHYFSLAQVADLIRQKDISPLELTRLMLARIEQVDSSLKSYAAVTTELALEQAANAEKEILAGKYRGPLHGIPIAVKDLCFTKGIPTKGGLQVLKDFVPSYNATVVEKLESSGAVLLGKLNLTEGALSGYNPNFPIPVNPWGEHLWAGVSSSGSGVATAAGLCFGAIGTDTGGSIRYPAMANGVVGLKPTYGRVSRYGVLELAGSLDHIGPMTRSTLDAALMLEVLAGKDSRDPTSLSQQFSANQCGEGGSLKGVRIGVDQDYMFAGTDAGLVSALHQVMEVLTSLGAELVACVMPTDGPMDLRSAWLPVTAYEAYKAHAAHYPAKADQYGGYLGDVLKMGMEMSAADYGEARERRNEIAARFEAQLGKVDAVICPSGGSVFSADKAQQYGNMETMKPIIKHFQGQFTIPADLAGTPALTLPCGFSADNTPFAVQFLGSKLSEATLCRIGIAFESVTQWHRHHPAI
ncbi:MAG: amidase [Pseudohongiellaceae bacterium]|jgi:amidase